MFINMIAAFRPSKTHSVPLDDFEPIDYEENTKRMFHDRRMIKLGSRSMREHEANLHEVKRS